MDSYDPKALAAVGTAVATAVAGVVAAFRKMGKDDRDAAVEAGDAILNQFKVMAAQYQADREADRARYEQARSDDKQQIQEFRDTILELRGRVAALEEENRRLRQASQ